MKIKLSTQKNQEFLKNLIRKDFDKKNTTHDRCKEIIKKTKSLGIPQLYDFIEELENDMRDAPMFT